MTASTNQTGRQGDSFDSGSHLNQLFQGLVPETIKAVMSVMQTRMYPKDTIIFAEGQLADGVYLLRRGQARVKFYLDRNTERLVGTVQSGALLGLSATIANEPYELSFETVGKCSLDFIDRTDFLHLLNERQDLCFRVVEILGQNLCDYTRTLDRCGPFLKSSM